MTEQGERSDPNAIGREFGEEPPAAAVAGALRALSAAAFLEEPIREPRWLCAEIIAEQSIGFIGGPPKAFKSFLALDLAMAVASGGAFCGRFVCPEPRRALIVQFESSRAHFQKRLRSIVSRYGAAPDNLFVVSNEPVLFEDHVAIGRLTRTIEYFRPSLLLLDPQSAMTGGDENSAQEMGAVVRQLRTWRDTYGCAIAVVHHTNKGAGGAQRNGLKLRGSSVFFAAAEFALWVERPDDAAARIEVRIEQKEAEPRRAFEVEFRETGAELVVVQDQLSIQVKDDEIVEAIVRRGRTATVQELVADLGLPERTLRDRMAVLVSVRRAYIEQGSGRGRKPLVWVVPKGTQVGPRLLTDREP